MKKFAVLIALTTLCSMSFAGGCWVNGKYVQCVKNSDTISQESTQR